MAYVPELYPSQIMAVPVQLTTTAQDETFGGVTYHIEGELGPAPQLELGAFEQSPAGFHKPSFCTSSSTVRP